VHIIRALNLCTYFSRSSRWRKRQRKAKETMGDDIRLDWEDAGGVCDKCKRQEELERTCASFCGLRPTFSNEDGKRRRR